MAKLARQESPENYLSSDPHLCYYRDVFRVYAGYYILVLKLMCRALYQVSFPSLPVTGFIVHVIGKPGQAAIGAQCLVLLTRVDSDTYRGSCQRQPEISEVT